MALRNIVTEGDPILAKKCREIGEITERIQILIDDMIETMHHEKGVGIAAPQVGVARRVCVIMPGEEDTLKVLINPEILEERGIVESTEGCLSVPGKQGVVDRPEYIKVKYLDRTGKEMVEEMTEFEAIVCCHETDHLEGCLYVDKARDVHYIEENAEEQS